MAKRYLMWTLGVFFISMLVFTFIPDSTYLYILSAITLLLVPAIFIRYSFKKTLIGCLLASLLALLLFAISNHIVYKVQDELLGNSAYVSGEIVETDVSSSGSLSKYKVHLRVANGKNVPSFWRFYIYLYGDIEGHYPGEIVSGTVSFFEDPIAFGYGREDRVFISGIQNEEELNFEPAQKTSVYQILYSFRSSVISKLKFGNSKTIGLLKALCFGDKSAIDYDLNISMQRIGLSHVMAVSGLHLSFAVLLFGFFFSVAGINYRIRYIIGIFISIFFTIAVGMPLSCLRACIMLCVFSIGMAFDWFSDSLTSLALAAFLIILINPYSVRDVGFLLSLSATFGIVALRSPIETFLFPKKIGENHRVIGIYRKFTGILACSISAMIATLPITIIVFRSVSLIGPLANVILIFPLQLMFMLGILSVAFGWIPFVGPSLGYICNLLYIIVDKISRFLGKLPFASASKIDLAGFILLGIFFLLLGVSIYLFIREKQRAFLSLFSLFLCFTLSFNFVYTRIRPVDDVQIAFIDVGQGDCTVISKGKRAVIFDYGGSSSHRYNLIDYLKRRGINYVELVAFTHLHDDHTNGIKSLYNNIYVEEMIYPPFDYQTDAIMDIISDTGREIEKSEKLTVLGDVTVQIIADALENKAGAGANERCVCYHVQYGKTTVLITGDLDGASEMKLIDKDLTATILKVSHHGSATSSFYPFLKSVAPEIAIISVGKNSYGLPKDEVIGRLYTICPEVILTMKEGTVCYQTDGIVLERINE